MKREELIKKLDTICTKLYEIVIKEQQDDKITWGEYETMSGAYKTLNGLIQTMRSTEKGKPF